MESARKELVDLAEALLQGPLAPDEILSAPPSDTYLTGILWPRGTLTGAESDNAETAADDSSDSTDTGIPGYRATRPCSIGLTFYVSRATPFRISLGTTARYAPASVDGGRFSKTWTRKELGYSVVIPAGFPAGDHVISEFEVSDGGTRVDTAVSVRIRLRLSGELGVCTITLVNELSDHTLGDEAALFQAQLVVEMTDADAEIHPRPVPPLIGDDGDARCNALLYRNEREYAIGHGIAAAWSVAEGPKVHQVYTSWMPRTAVTGTSPEGHMLLNSFMTTYPRGLDAAWLGREDERTDIIKALRTYAETYHSWIETHLAARIEQLDIKLREAALLNLSRCSTVCERILGGIDLLETDDAAWTAFALANRAMDLQSQYRSKEAPRPLKWRPFQLGFVLMVIPGLVDSTREDRSCMDLLWFPTGGGKTEAYLGLAAFQIFHRRLISLVARKTGGTDVLMRYTLRLLTIQQFQRAAALIVACELIRVEDDRLGTARITIGLYVGGDNTPNRMEKAREAIDAERNGQKPSSTPVQLLQCPACGSNLDFSHYHPSPVGASLDVICRESSCEMGGAPLPVQMVDEALYAAPPSLLIGTVDKFAQLPRTAEIRPLFGLDGREAPALIIQDELHLISGPLGSMTGLYETAIDLICTRRGVRPKIIGSTATIGQASSQVRALFDRAVLQFPPPGFDAEDSFFAVKDAKGPDRLYVGVPTAGRSPKFALQAVLAVLLQAASTLRQTEIVDEQSVDPYWTCVTYFNSLRELGGAHVLLQDDVPRHMNFMASRLGSSVRRLDAPPVELSSRKSSRELPGVLQALSTTLTQFASALETEGLGFSEMVPQPEDSVLASNMISVGVDVPRLGLMVINGQPKSTAEYIQASSRVGRTAPGLVFTLYNFARPRDLSHYEHFQGYHAALYRNVEASSVTPWAARARDKALHAVVAAVVRHLVPGMVSDESAVNFDSDSEAVLELLGSVLERAERALAAIGGEPSVEMETIHAELEGIAERWSRAARQGAVEGGLLYWKKNKALKKGLPYLMCSAEDALPSEQAYATPGSMREVEPSAAFVFKRIN